MKASEVQIGGDHYKQMKYQPIEFIVKLKLNFFQANICKYITRHRLKNGKADVEKARHYAELAIEYLPIITDEYVSPGLLKYELSRYRDENRLSVIEAAIINEAASGHYYNAVEMCGTLINSMYHEKSK